MRYSYIGLIVLLALCSCQLFKAKSTLQLKQDTMHIEQIKLYNETLLGQSQQKKHRTEHGAKSTMEIFADDVFSWHPDSGIQSKKGNLKVKIRLERSHQQLLSMREDSLRANLAGTSIIEAAGTSQSLSAAKEYPSEKGGAFDKYRQWTVFIILWIVCLGLLLKLFRQVEPD